MGLRAAGRVDFGAALALLVRLRWRRSRHCRKAVEFCRILHQVPATGRLVRNPLRQGIKRNSIIGLYRLGRVRISWYLTLCHRLRPPLCRPMKGEPGVTDPSNNGVGASCAEASLHRAVRLQLCGGSALSKMALFLSSAAREHRICCVTTSARLRYGVDVVVASLVQPPRRGKQGSIRGQTRGAVLRHPQLSPPTTSSPADPCHAAADGAEYNEALSVPEPHARPPGLRD